MSVATPESATGPLSWKVGGMDCAGCAAKIRSTVGRMPGVSDVRLSVMTETLTLLLDESRTSRASIEKQVSSLGYSMQAIAKPAAPSLEAKPDSCGCGHDHDDGHKHEGKDGGNAHKHTHAPAHGEGK